MKSFFDPAFCSQSILSLNVSETTNDYTLTMLAPGLQRSDIKVFIKGDKVTITNKKESIGHPPLDPEYSFSTFTKTFTTLHEIDKGKIKISYKNDMISITLPKVCRDIPLTKSASHPFVTEI